MQSPARTVVKFQIASKIILPISVGYDWNGKLVDSIVSNFHYPVGMNFVAFGWKFGMRNRSDRLNTGHYVLLNT